MLFQIHPFLPAHPLALQAAAQPPPGLSSFNTKRISRGFENLSPFSPGRRRALKVSGVSYKRLTNVFKADCAAAALSTTPGSRGAAAHGGLRPRAGINVALLTLCHPRWGELRVLDGSSLRKGHPDPTASWTQKTPRGWGNLRACLPLWVLAMLLSAEERLWPGLTGAGFIPKTTLGR